MREWKHQPGITVSKTVHKKYIVLLTDIIGLGGLSKTMHTPFSQQLTMMSLTTTTSSNSIQLPCPFIGNDVRIDLQGHKLSLAQKQYLGQQLATKTATVHSFQLQYNLPRTRLYKYRNKMKIAAANGIAATIYEKSGRPKCMDARSEYEIAHKLHLEPTMTERQLRSLIREKSVKRSETTIVRQQNTISMRSVRRYSKSLRNMASNMCYVVESSDVVVDPNESSDVGVEEDDHAQTNTSGELEKAAVAAAGSSSGSIGDFVHYFYSAFWSNHNSET